ncbi:MAG: hypothetical protein GWO00_05035, partial [Gemmatimonadetes bacterium]|nr:hypothetical protein [Gemmatimonadota bacterium]NIT86297.1 hypothetical protein [Gemmatimonadota bacterium]NIU30131.1 hypothetical protein [Gemmatimonadota bacterium]NIV60525.1 hypothetical protein [Gemmatimonadota bacterium]NIW63203.1 hypothetical protein [Gemmatimonadota bacterium]
VPAFSSGRDVIRELDPLLFQRYAAPPPAEESAEPDEADEPEEAPEEPAEVVSFDEEVGAAVAELERIFAEEEAAPLPAERTTGDEPGAPGIAEDIPSDRFEALFGGGDALGVAGTTAAPRPGRPGADRGGVGLGITERSAGEAAAGAPGGGADAPGRGGADLGAGLEAVTATRREATGESEVVIGEYEAESLTGSEADRLGAWMRGHSAALPVGVRAHVNFEPSFLTSVVPFSSEGREWELFLMFNESLRELHIVLVEGDRSIYMIDRGFQEESRSLREGTVRRVDGEIMAIDSRSASASGERAREFYNVFLSWWESAKDDVESR